MRMPCFDSEGNYKIPVKIAIVQDIGPIIRDVYFYDLYVMDHLVACAEAITLQEAIDYFKLIPEYRNINWDEVELDEYTK
jgi:hypothetical protein